MQHFGKIPKKFGQNLAKFSKIQQKISKVLAKFATICKKSAKSSAIFNEKIEIRERCKGVHCVDLGESFPDSNEYLLAKFGIDTAENEPCKVCPIERCSSPKLSAL